ncbi:MULTISPECIES: hypothetical protein [Paenibacillus]|nr:hypothetical protein [Paenibacillus borealis]
MKKHIILTAVIAAVLGIQPGFAAPVQAEGSAAASAGASKSVVTEAAKKQHAEAVYKTTLSLLKSSSTLHQGISYLNSNIYSVTPYQAALMTLRLENLQKSLLQSWESKFSSNEIQRKLTSIYKEGSSMAKLAESTEDAALSSLLKSAGESGYKLENAEGTFFPIIDYSTYRRYKMYVTDDIRDYITIMAIESELPSSKDNGLVISWTDVAARALSQEEFTLSYPKSNRIAAVKSLYSMYVGDTFYGQNNTPLFHYDNLEMDLEAQKAYSSILAKHNGSSQFLQKLDGLMKLLKENGYKLDEGVQQYLKTEVPLT